MTDHVPWRDYVDTRFAAQEKHAATVQELSQRAINKAEENTASWKASANEWRGAMTDREKHFFTVAEAKAMDARIDDLSERVKARDARGEGLHQGWAILLAVIGAAGVVATIVMNVTRAVPVQ